MSIQYEVCTPKNWFREHYEFGRWRANRVSNQFVKEVTNTMPLARIESKTNRFVSSYDFPVSGLTAFDEFRFQLIGQSGVLGCSVFVPCPDGPEELARIELPDSGLGFDLATLTRMREEVAYLEDELSKANLSKEETYKIDYILDLLRTVHQEATDNDCCIFVSC